MIFAPVTHCNACAIVSAMMFVAWESPSLFARLGDQIMPTRHFHRWRA